MNKLFLALLIVAELFLSGCLTFHKVSYDVNLEGPKNGTVTMTINDIRSDAETKTQFEEDKDTLFNYILKSDVFLKTMLDEGKNFISRELYVENKRYCTWRI